MIPYPKKVVVDGEEFTAFLRLTVHPTRNRFSFVLRNGNGVLSRTCWAPGEEDTARGIKEGRLKVFTGGSHLEFVYKEVSNE